MPLQFLHNTFTSLYNTGVKETISRVVLQLIVKGYETLCEVGLCQSFQKSCYLLLWHLESWRLSTLESVVQYHNELLTISIFPQSYWSHRNRTKNGLFKAYWWVRSAIYTLFNLKYINSLDVLTERFSKKQITTKLFTPFCMA